MIDPLLAERAADILERRDLGPSDKVVGVATASLTWQEEKPVKMRLIADKAGVSRETAIESLRRLEERGVLRVQRAPGKPSLYRMAA